MSDDRREVRPWDILKDGYRNVPKHIEHERYAICEKCESFNSLLNKCKECGCFMQLKTKFPDAFCPKNKWDVYIPEEEEAK